MHLFVYSKLVLGHRKFGEASQLLVAHIILIYFCQVSSSHTFGYTLEIASRLSIRSARRTTKRIQREKAGIKPKWRDVQTALPCKSKERNFELPYQKGMAAARQMEMWPPDPWRLSLWYENWYKQNGREISNAGCGMKWLDYRLLHQQKLSFAWRHVDA